MAITVSVLFGGIMHQYAPMLLAITDPALQKLKLLAWYLGFACFYALGVYAIYKIHQVLRVNYQFIARMILLQFFVLGQLQLLRYAERLLWDTHYLKPLYQSGIVGVNVTTAIVTLGFALTVGYSQYQVNKGKKGVKWIL
ncbi:MAG: cytochrome c biogenesis protein CcdA [Phenylobacterium sp.]